MPTEALETFRAAEAIAVPGRPAPGCTIAFLGEVDGSAEEGRSGRFQPAAFAFFCAAIVSLIEGLMGIAFVLFENAGLAPVVGAWDTAFCGFGLEGSSINNFCWTLSRADMRLGKH